MDVWVMLNERKKSEELNRTLRIGTIQFDDQKSRLTWFEHVERKDGTVVTGASVI